MTDDLIARLRRYSLCLNPNVCIADRGAVDEAATALEALRAENERLREAISMALKCTPHVRDGVIIYDCGDPWEILRKAFGD